MRRGHFGVPGEEALEKGFHIKLGVWHDACVQVEVVQTVVPAGINHTSCIGTSVTHTHTHTHNKIITWPVWMTVPPHLSLTSCAVVMTEATLPVSTCSRATWAAGWEASSAERAAWARRMLLQARHSWRPPASWERRRSHSIRPMPLQGGDEVIRGRRLLWLESKTIPHMCTMTPCHEGPGVSWQKGLKTWIKKPHY